MSVPEIGRTKDVGWEIGVSATVPFPLEQVWALVTSPEGVATWIGPGATLVPEKGATFEADDGTTGEVRSLRPEDRVRVTLRPAGWDHETTAQVTVSRSGPEKTVLRFHQEWLADAAERERQRTVWKAVLGRLRERLDTGT